MGMAYDLADSFQQRRDHDRLSHHRLILMCVEAIRRLVKLGLRAKGE